MRHSDERPPGEFYRDDEGQDEAPPRKAPRVNSPIGRRGSESWRAGDRAYFVGVSIHLQNGDQHIYGAEVEILTAATPSGGHLVRFPNNKMPSDITSQDLSRERRDIPGGWKVFDKAYFGGASVRHPDGDQQIFGTKVEVVGGTANPASLLVKFPGNRCMSEVHVQHLSHEKREIIDRWRPWERAYFVGAGSWLPNGERHLFGSTVEVLGNAPDGESLLVMFPNGRQPAEVAATDLSSEKIPLNGGWRPGEKAFFSGISAGYKNGDKEIFGAKVDILGNCSESGGLCVRFPSNKAISHVNCGDLSRQRVEIVGGWLLQEKAFFKGRSETFQNGDRHTYGDRVDVVGNCSISGGVAVKFPRNMGTSGVDPRDLCKEKPSPQDAPEPVAAAQAQGNAIRWRHKASQKGPLMLRQGPTMGSKQTQDALQPGEAFDVDDMKKVVLGGQNITFLHLADGRGWIFDQLPGVGPVCEMVTSAAVEQYGGCFLPRQMDGIDVVTEEAPGMFLVNNQHLHAETDGLGFRKSKKMSDQVGMGVYAAWGSVFEGVDVGDGWVMVKDKAKEAAAERTRALQASRALPPARGGLPRAQGPGHWQAEAQNAGEAAAARPLPPARGGLPRALGPGQWQAEAAQEGPGESALPPARGGVPRAQGHGHWQAESAQDAREAAGASRPVMRQMPKAGKGTPIFAPAPKALPQTQRMHEHGEDDVFEQEDQYFPEPGG